MIFFRSKYLFYWPFCTPSSPWNLPPGVAAALPCPLAKPVYSGIYVLPYYLFYLLARWKLKSTKKYMHIKFKITDCQRKHFL
jgi:hypothetical protein